MLLQLTDGTNTVTLSGDGGVLRGCTYFPQTPDADAEEVAETAEITLRGPQAQARAAVNGVERMLRLAAARQAGEDAPRVYAQYAAADGEPAYRSEVLEGRVTWSSDPGLRRLGDPAPTVQAAVLWRRRPFWEGPEAALPSQQIANGPAGNTVLWSGVLGALPAPARITLTNASGAALAARRFYLFNDAGDSFGASGAFFYPTQAHAAWGAGLRHSDMLWRIDIPAASAAKMKGERRRILAAFAGVSENVYLRADLFANVDGYLLPMQEGVEARTGGPNGRDLLDLGAVNLPPAGDIGSPAAYAVVLTGWSDAAGSGSLRWLHIGPAAPSMTLKQQGFWLEAGASIVHDGMEGVSYLASAQRFPVVEAAGGLTLRPSAPNRIRILFDEGVLFDPTRTLQVSGVYRPRRAAV